ncbi:MAG: transposase [Propionivibrio sp.]|nr:transposase [Propionivibrio sp.]
MTTCRQVLGRWFYLYLIQDLYSRKIVGWEIHAGDQADHAARIGAPPPSTEASIPCRMRSPCCTATTAPLKATTVLAMLNWLGVNPSYSRPRVCDDNAYAESLFRTAKYRRDFPTGLCRPRPGPPGRSDFVRWYNFDHRHGGIRYVRPAQRHAEDDLRFWQPVIELYLKARELNPTRWSATLRNWTPIGDATRNQNVTPS